MRAPSKLFQLPFGLVEHAESFEIQDAAGQALAFVYFEDEQGRAGSLKRMGKDPAKRLASQIQRLPELLEELKRLRAARERFRLSSHSDV
jgi:hypothetical protein